jgi:hypothetical protein
VVEHKELSKQEISDRAYQLYLQRGSEPGRHVEDWVLAEQELTIEVITPQTKTKAASSGRTSN